MESQPPRHVSEGRCLAVVLAAITCVTFASIALVLTAPSPLDFYMALIPGASPGYLFLGLLAAAAALRHAPFRHGATVLSIVLLLLWLDSLVQFHRPHWLAYDYDMIHSGLVNMGLGGGFALLWKAKAWGRWFAWSMVGLSVIGWAVYAVPIGIALSGGDVEHSDMPMRVMQIFHCCVPAPILLINAGRGDRRYFRWPGVVAALLAGAVYVYLWMDPMSDYWALLIFAGELCWGMAFTLAIVNMLLTVPSQRGARLLQRATIALVLLAGANYLASEIGVYWETRGLAQEPLVPWVRFLETAVPGTVILAAGALLSFLIHHVLFCSAKPAPVLAVDRVKLQCPNCGMPQEAPLQGTCPRCRLQFQMTFTEPRCARCQHILLNLTSDRCPECGAPVTAP